MLVERSRQIANYPPLTNENTYEEQLLEQTLNTGGTRELIYNVDGFDRIENLQHSSYQSSIKDVELCPGLCLTITNASCK